jgi:acyl-CoA synthetase (NDP forming)
MSLDHALEPGSVAVYGASATRPDALGSSLLRNAAACGLPVVAVHPSAVGTIGDAPVAPTLRAAGGAELALVSVPAAGAPAAVRDAVDGGARAVVVLSSGFAEAGDAGRRLQDEVVATAAAADVTLIGPNCMGVVSRLASGQLLNGSYFWSVPDRDGGLAFVSQSGAIGGLFLAEARRRMAGFSRFISIGNAASVDVADCLAWLADDERTTAIGVFVEGITDGPRFLEAASRATAAKPVVLLKGGRFATGARAAASHTGALAGQYGPIRAALRRARVEEAGSSRDLFDRLFSLGLPPVTGRSVAIVTVSGGPSVLAADALAMNGLELADLAPVTVARLEALLPDFAAKGNPVDLTPQCAPDRFVPAIRAVFEDPNVDAVVAVDFGLDLAEFGRGVVEAAAATGKPVVASLLDVDTVQGTLGGAGVPVSSSPEGSVELLALALGRSG